MTTLENLSEITGIKKPEIDSILQEVKAIQKTLAECIKPHDFSICIDRRTKQVLTDPTPTQRFGAKWKCSKCGGIVDSLHKIHYNEGLKDAK